MGKKWGSNENIHIGDIYDCTDPTGDWERFQKYYQVTALRGKTQVVLHAINWETYINEGIREDSSLYWRRKRIRPLPGQFRSFEDTGIKYVFRDRGKFIELATEEVTAWVMPEQFYFNGSPRLQAVGLAWKKLGLWFEQVMPKDWEPWDAETIRKLEEYERQQNEVFIRHLKGEEDVPWPEYPI